LAIDFKFKRSIIKLLCEYWRDFILPIGVSVPLLSRLLGKQFTKLLSEGILIFKTNMPVKPKPTITIFASSCTPIPEGYEGRIDVLNTLIRIKYKNVITSLAEADIEVIIEPYDSVPTKAFRFHLKANSDSNKAALASQLKLAFSDLASGWTLIVNELTVIFLEALNNHKQNFKLSEVEGEQKSWLFEPFIMEHSINVLFGMGSAGKTLTSLYFSVLYGQGKGLWGKSGRKGNTLLIDFENDQIEWRDTLKNLLGSQDIDLELAETAFHYWQSEQIPLYNQVEKLKNFIREKKIDLVIVDSASMAAGDSTSDEAAALRLMGALKLLDTTVLLLAHERKNDGEGNPIGSIQYFNQARNIWHIKNDKEGLDNELDISCKHTKCNGSFLRKDPIGFKIFFKEGLISVNAGQSVLKEDYPLGSLIINELKLGSLSVKGLASNLDKKEANIRTTLHRLKGQNKVREFDGNWSNIT
jgi:hypothetical protein